MKRWRRPLILIALLLLAGAVVNVAVAWGIAACAKRDRSFPVTIPWNREHDDELSRMGGWGWWREQQSVEVGGHWTDATSFASGWPTQSVECCWESRWRVTSESIDVIQEPTPLLAGGLHVPASLPSRCFAEAGRRLPLAPIPAGFAINTLFYAAILALPLSFFPIRRRLRARRGRCPKCGYDRAGLADPAAPCPECGATR